jgi:hypothetical protein
VHHHPSYAARRFEQPDDVIVLCDDCHSRHYETSTAAKIASGIEDVGKAERYRSPRRRESIRRMLSICCA